MDSTQTGRGGAYAAAENIAEAAADAWYRSYGPHNTEAMIGTIAALALDAAVAEKPGSAYRERIRAACRTDAGGWLARFWAAAWIVRPDLVSVAAPLYQWLEGDTRVAVLEAAAAAADAAIAAGVLEFGARMRHDADVLGLMVQQVHSRSAARATGTFHSPPEIGALMTRMITGGRQIMPGHAFADECAGTGEMARAAAERLREQGADPAGQRWFLNDRDPVAAACAAVNAWLWDLGPHVTIGRADILLDPHWPLAAALDAAEARAHRDHLIEHARSVAQMILLLRGPHATGTLDEQQEATPASA